MSNFGPVISPGLVVKMTNSLVKEIRVGIAAARSGMNLQTKFKKKNEQINLILRNYLDYLEDMALNRISEKKFKALKYDWREMIKTRMPKFYRMEAKTLFFNFYELEMIRRSMTEDIEPFFSSKIKNLMFATSAKVYTYLNQAVSVRIILAKFYKIAEEDILPEDLAEYKEDLLLRDQAIKEEEDSFDDELDETPIVVEEKKLEAKIEGEEEAFEEEVNTKKDGGKTTKDGKKDKETKDTKTEKKEEKVDKNEEKLDRNTKMI